MIAWATVGLLTLLPAVNTLLNVRRLRIPSMALGRPRVTILIPARNEQATIGACVDAALANVGVDLDVIVLDDASSDRTRQIVERRALADARLQIVMAPPLPPGVKGKPYACDVLAGLTDSPYLLFVDADVQLSETAASRLVPPDNVDMVSGVPRQITVGTVETAVIPMINSLIFGYLPIGMMRREGRESLAVACGQMIMVRASAYRQCGGHASIAHFMHDGMQLAKLFRRRNFRTDLVDGTRLATCRMYDTAAAVFQGFSKNATEGMARPVALPIWTVLLLGGHVAPLFWSVHILTKDPIGVPSSLGMLAVTILLGVARVMQAIKCGESLKAVWLHPVGVFLTLAIQWRALYCSMRGRPVEWRGRAYVPNA